ncbi:MAG: amidohydrolase [Homoserinimonas sp.]
MISTNSIRLNKSTSVLVDECWLGGWRGPSVLVADAAGIRLATDTDARPDLHLAGTVFPGFIDSHVHLGLGDAEALLSGGIAEVNDLGWDPQVARTWVDRQDLPKARFAGAFLTAVGAYPAGRDWAPDKAVVEVAGSEDGRAAVDAQLEAGASFIKVVLNSDAGPVLDDVTLRAIVGHSHVRGREVIAHVEGAGQAARAFGAGADRFAHTPWTERLDDDLLKAMAGPKARTLSGAQSWISTLDIHGWGEYTDGFVVAKDNLRRFHAFGGAVSYGTDFGNGPLPAGVNERELRALIAVGLSENGVIRAMTPHKYGHALSYVAGERRDELSEWLAGASVITAGQLLDRDLPIDEGFSGD